MPDYILSPVGRLVQGSAFESQTTDATGKPLTTIKGDPKVQYFFAVAFPKNAMAATLISQSGERSPVQDLRAYCDQLAQAAWPQGAARHPQFASKILDGDQPPIDGTPREGFAGCWVFRFSGGFPVQVVNEDASQVLGEPADLRRGYFVRVLFTYSGNGQSMKPGMYCNPYKVQRVAFGPEIVTGPSAADVFGAPAGPLPAGASPVPVAGSFSPAPPASGAPVAPQVGLQAPEAHAVRLAPAHDYLQGPGALPTPPAPAPPAPPAAPVLTMTAKAGGATLEAFTAAGWTVDALLAQGYAVRS